jgi:hypothetical protein
MLGNPGHQTVIRFRLSKQSRSHARAGVEIGDEDTREPVIARLPAARIDGYRMKMTRPGSGDAAAGTEALTTAGPGTCEAVPGQGIREAGERPQRVAEEQAALRRIAVQVARAAAPEELFAASPMRSTGCWAPTSRPCAGSTPTRR